MLKGVFIWGLNLISIEAQRTAFVVLFTHGRRRHYAHPEFRVHNVVDVGRGAVTSAFPTTALPFAPSRLVGPTRTSGDVRFRAAVEGKADIERALILL